MAVKLGKVSTKKSKTKAEEAFYEPKLNPNKRRTTPSPKMTSEKYFHLFLKEQPDIVAIYGLDKHTENLIETAWKNPEINIVCCHPVEQILANINRKMGQLSFSMYRWEVRNPSMFFEHPVAKIVVVAKDYYDEAKKRGNPFNTTYVILEDLF